MPIARRIVGSKSDILQIAYAALRSNGCVEQVHLGMVPEAIEAREDR